MRRFRLIICIVLVQALGEYYFSLSDLGKSLIPWSSSSLKLWWYVDRVPVLEQEKKSTYVFAATLFREGFRVYPYRLSDCKNMYIVVQLLSDDYSGMSWQNNAVCQDNDFHCLSIIITYYLYFRFLARVCLAFTLKNLGKVSEPLIPIVNK